VKKERFGSLWRRLKRLQLEEENTPRETGKIETARGGFSDRRKLFSWRERLNEKTGTDWQHQLVDGGEVDNDTGKQWRKRQSLGRKIRSPGRQHGSVLGE